MGNTADWSLELRISNSILQSEEFLQETMF